MAVQSFARLTNLHPLPSPISTSLALWRRPADDTATSPTAPRCFPPHRTACDDGAVTGSAAAACLAKPGAHSFGVNGLAFSGDGHLLASCGSDKLVKLWVRVQRVPVLQYAAPLDPFDVHVCTCARGVDSVRVSMGAIVYVCVP